LLGFSRALDDELREYNIRVGTVSPAGVRTDMVAERFDIDHTTFMSPDEVAEAVMYLVTADGPGIVYEMRIWRMNR
jgi:short-subunit dehydrogenase